MQDRDHGTQCEGEKHEHSICICSTISVVLFPRFMFVFQGDDVVNVVKLSVKRFSTILKIASLRKIVYFTYSKNVFWSSNVLLVMEKTLSFVCFLFRLIVKMQHRYVSFNYISCIIYGLVGYRCLSKVYSI